MLLGSKSYLLFVSPNLQLQVLQGVWDRSFCAFSHTLGPPTSSGRWVWTTAAPFAPASRHGKPLNVTTKRRREPSFFPPPKGKWFLCTSPDEGCARASVLSSLPRPGFRRTTLPTSPHLPFPNVWSECCSSQVFPITHLICRSTSNASRSPNVYFFITDYLSCGKHGAIRISVNKFGGGGNQIYVQLCKNLRQLQDLELKIRENRKNSDHYLKSHHKKSIDNWIVSCFLTIRGQWCETVEEPLFFLVCIGRPPLYIHTVWILKHKRKLFSLSCNQAWPCWRV